ncbi:hypothetical protein AUJ65_04600 [Candidatus Micrarchaeota archaeon CG1_02_51_15]|nr:MAG: hypothetical protein AUJ65_04600 [Candidatus Micrarchaeota archaeon CG1_02_51_15]
MFTTGTDATGVGDAAATAKAGKTKTATKTTAKKRVKILKPKTSLNKTVSGKLSLKRLGIV